MKSTNIPIPKDIKRELAALKQATGIAIVRLVADALKFALANRDKWIGCK